MKNLSILGSTGSIGTQSLDVCRMHSYNVKCLTANTDVQAMESQIREFRPELVCMMDENAAAELKTCVADTGVKIVSGLEGLVECAVYPGADTVLNSVVGMIGLTPTLEAIKAKKTIALANKETLVAGGSLVTEAARENGVSILPVDSEHSAIFQAMQGSPRKEAVKKIILTASGGPFFGKTLSELENVTVQDALRHPNWNMGAKITIDSATMMNKGLEFIEAKWLFDLPNEDIEIVVHRESVVHSAIVYQDNSMIAQLGVPDMRIPIQYALTYPEREPSPVEPLSLAEYGKLTFFEPDYKTFRCMDVCKKAIEMGGLHPAAANGANEESVKLFLKGKIKFTDIAYLNEEAMLKAEEKTNFTLDDVLCADKAAREYVINNYR
ncbi:MAG TPA: 1-deoxy-D-xylulose-5-phosphate reductoisomerase [Candidatus Eubacterium faecavium]|nr:1-deoxy-D-xylulose-5-phosphate reductoisomerase [Candidatus Eubacterium faecavium]